MPESDQTPAQANSAERFACHAARLMADSRCENLLVLDVRGISQQITETRARHLLIVDDDAGHGGHATGSVRRTRYPP